MATFQPDNTAPDPTNFTGRSQGIPANRAFEVAAEGITATVEGLAKAKDFQIQSNIRQDVEDIFNVTNQQFGYDEEMGMNAVPPDAVPEEFKAGADSFKERLSKTVAARNQGSLTDTHYYTLLNYSMKNVKSKYPGYHDIVDNIYQQVTGERPANSLRAAIKEEWARAESDVRANADDLSKAVEKYSNEITIVDPNFFDNQDKYSEADTRKVLAQARKLAGQKEQVKAENDRLTLESKIDTFNVDKAKATYNTRIGMAVEQNVNSMFSRVVGPKGGNFNSLVTAAAQGKATPEDLQLLTNLVADAKFNTQNEIRSLFTNPDSFEWVSKISAEERKAVEDAAMARFNYIEERLVNKDFGAILTTERGLKFMADQDMTKLMDKFSGTRVYGALAKISPDLANNWAYKSGFYDELSSAILPGMLAQSFSGDMSIDDAMTAIDNDDLSQDQRNNTMSAYIIEAKKSLISDAASPSDVAQFVTKNFGGDKPAIDAFYEKVGPQNHTQLYNMWTEPRVIDKVLASGDKQAILSYTAWVKDKIDELPEMATALANISSRRTNGSIQRNFDIEFDPATRTLRAVPNAAGKQAAQTQLLDMPGGPTSGNVILDREIMKQNKMLEPINLAIKNMTTVLDKTKDLTGLDSVQTLQQILNDNGVQITIPTAKTGEAVQGAPGPFSELESLDPNAPINLTAFSDEALKDVQFTWTEEQAAEALASGNYSSLLNFIGDKEAPKGYNQVFGKNNFLPREDMTLDEVLQFQDEMVRNGSPSSAVGRYQFIRKTLRGLKEELGLTGTEKFTPELQDQLASKLVERRGGKDFVEGKITREEFMKNLSQEWASLPKDTSGGGFYDGDGLNNAYASPTQTLAAIDSLLEAGKPLNEMKASVDWNSIGYGNIPEDEREDFLVWNNNPIKNSETNLATVRPEMQAIVKLAQTYGGPQFVVGSGKRDKEQQKKAIDLGWSKTLDSRHLGGDAVDVWVLDENGQVTFDSKYYDTVADNMIRAASDLGYELEWGGNWKNFRDIPHFEFEGNRIIIGERGQDPVYNEIAALREEYGL